MIDVFTSAVMTATVCNVAGAVFVIDTVVRRDNTPGRIWALGFISAMMSTLAYAMWAAGMAGTIGVALANLCFALTPGFIWVGARSFNQRRLGPALIVLAALGVVVFVAAFVPNPSLGDWAGWFEMSGALVVLTLLAALETLRRPLARSRTAWILAGTMIVAATYYLARPIVYLAAGPDSGVFRDFFDTAPANMMTIAVIVVGVVVTSTLRAVRADMRNYSWMSARGVASDGVASRATFTAALADATERAGWRSELLGVVSVRIEDIQQIELAFGSDIAGRITQTWRQSVRRYCAPTSIVGEDDERGLFVIIVASTFADARRQGATIYRGLFKALGTVSGAVIPVIGVGVALSSETGYDPVKLMDHARAAAREAATSLDSSVVVASPEPRVHAEAGEE